MLPVVPTLATPPQPASQAAAPLGLRWRSWWRALLLSLLLVLLPLGLGGCSGAAQPPRTTLLHALALQIQLTQGAIATALSLEPPGTPEVSRVRIEQQQAITIGDGRGLRLAGRFDWRLAADPIRVDSPFEIYLQRGERGQSWRLARPIEPEHPDEPQQWLIDPLPIKG
ncbi:MAG: hypothetical protein FJ077_09340 [Cyanobacteria bacterium K_DeepCast_35m_m2_023]|nr:hypothetical protein [Cyanobacteria bacterium K_DeepCast_35m_m2_023]